MANVSGCLWVEGNALHWIDGSTGGGATGVEWSFVGTQVGAQVGAIPGSVWHDTEDDQIHYIDEYSVERYLNSKYEGGWGGHSDGAVHLDGAAKRSQWIDTDNILHFIRQAATGAEDYVHLDVDHIDYYTDVHTDIKHADGHGDADDHGDDHTAINHQDWHTDQHGDKDWVTPYLDTYADEHTDVAHVDQHDDDYSHSDQHNDRVHGDTDIHHLDQDDHGDQPHTDAHSD